MSPSIGMNPSSSVTGSPVSVTFSFGSAVGVVLLTVVVELAFVLVGVVEVEVVVVGVVVVGVVGVGLVVFVVFANCCCCESNIRTFTKNR